jgi:hypothetical protein
VAVALHFSFRSFLMSFPAQNETYHLAFPAWYKVDYLLTWNCKHLANGVTRKVIETLNKQLNFHTPIICAPEELMEV